MEQKKTLTVKQWADEDKPREKMLSQGKKQLSNVELIAILLRSGMKGKSVVDVAREVLDNAGNSLTTLSRMEYQQLNSIKGMAEAKSTTLMAALELGWRMQGEINTEKLSVINDSNDLFKFLMPRMVDLGHEEFWVVFLNVHNRILGSQRISMGGQVDTPVDLRILFRSAIENRAVNIAVAHNHPSGSLKPSTADRRLTRSIAEAGKLLGIHLMEHIIIALGPDYKPDYYSFHDNGEL